ncbi:MAG: GNAT family N-acetyltransferase [Microbacteriaceae bacterium]|nr:GNAT family N-acetyltransferase [Microbacteriaceae bacterium]
MANVAAHPLDPVDWPVETERLLLRPATEDDFPAVWAYRRLPEVSRWLGAQPPDFETYADRYRAPERLATQVLVLHSGTIVGDLMVRFEDPWAQAESSEQVRGTLIELGWSFDPAWHGRGLATEAVRAAIGLAFGPLGVRRVVANCFAENEPSWRLMERLGMRREAHNVRDSYHSELGWLDNLTYALLVEEWPTASGRAAT